MSRAIMHHWLWILWLGACVQEQAPEPELVQRSESDAAPSPRKVASFDNPEARRTLDRVRGSLSHSTAGLKLEQQARGAPRLHLQGRFHSATIAVRDADGHVQRHCVDDPEQLDRMLGVTQ